MQIALIDDNEIDIFVNQKLIETAPFEASIRSFLNPNDGLSNLQESQADLIIVDNQMPELTGYQFLEKVLAFSNGNPPKMIVLTATVREDLVNQYQSLHQEIILWEKPLNVENLTSLLSEV
jgi:CheY-like chemotaxis protein